MSLIEKLGLDNRDFNKSMDESADKVKDFEKQTQDASKTVDDFGKSGAKSAHDLIQEMANLDKSERSVSNYKRQLAQLTREISDLTIRYRGMSKEMQNSNLGREVVAKIQQLSDEASRYKDAIQDAQAGIKNLASDTMYWDAAKQGITAVSGALQLVSSAGILGAQNTEKLVKVIARLKTIESSVNGIIAIGNALQKDSALMTGIRAVQAKLLAKAQLEEAAATEAAGVAQAKFNLIASANPYIILASAAITAITAIVAFSKAMDDNAKKAEEAKKAAEAYSKSIDKIVDAVGGAQFNFDELASAYRKCRTEAEKQEFMTKYKSNLDSLGLGMANIADLEDIFVNSTEQFRDACIKRAQSMALTQEIADEYKKTVRAMMEAENILSNIKPGQRVNEDDPAYDLLKKYGAYTDYVARLGDDYVNASDDFADKVIDGIQADFERIKTRLKTEQDTLMSGYEGVVSGLKGYSDKLNNNNNNNNNNNKKEDKSLDGSISKLKEQIALVQKLKDEQVVGTDEWIKWFTILQDLNKQLDAAIGKEHKIAHPEWDELTKPIEVPAIAVPNKVELPKDLKPKPVDLNIRPQIDPMAVTEAVDILVDQFQSGLSDIDNIVSPINDIYEAFSGLGDKIKEAQGPWETFFAVFETGMTVLSSVAKIIEGLNAAIDLLNTLQAAGIIAKKADTKVTNENTRAKIKNAGASGASAIAESMNSAAQTPIVGWLLAIAAGVAVLAALMSAMTTARGFATGGIVPGSSFHGDNNLIRANSGEMVLTSDQQKKLWDFISKGSKGDNDSSVGGNVTFRISGSDLVGTLNNYNKKNSRL